MGKVAKKVVEKQKEDEKRTAEFIGDLLWYIQSMNDCIKQFVNEANQLNAMLTASREKFEENKDVMVQ